MRRACNAIIFEYSERKRNREICMRVYNEYNEGKKSRRSIKSNSFHRRAKFFLFFFFFFKNITLLLFPPRFNAFYRERNIFSKFSIHPTWRTTWVAYGKKFERRIKGTLRYTVLNSFLEIFYYLNSKIILFR